jgi:two-component system response regulator YesN
MRKEKILERTVLSRLEEGNLPTNDRVEAALQFIRVECRKEGGVKAFVSIGQDKLTFQNSYNCFCFKIGYNKYAYFTNNREACKIYHDDWLKKNIISIGISNFIDRAENILGAVGDAEIAAYQYFVTGARRIYHIQEKKENGLLMQQLEEAFNIRNLQDIRLYLDRIESKFSEGLYNIKDAFIFYNTVIGFLKKANYDENKVDFLYDYKQLFDLFGQVQNMMEYLKELLEHYLGLYHPYSAEMVKNDYFRNILYYINQNYLKSISLQDISEKFTVNPSYISQLFKKETGINYIDYLTKLRISYACELLKKTDLTVSIISEKTGYNDCFYFTKIFKKKTGNTPSQYRRQYKKTENTC